MANKKRYNYIRKKIVPGTWFRVMTAIISFVLLVSCIVISTCMEGQGPLFVGALGISSIIMAVYTVFKSMVFEKDPECNYIPLYVAGIAAGIIVILWVILLLLGLFF